MPPPGLCRCAVPSASVPLLSFLLRGVRRPHTVGDSFPKHAVNTSLYAPLRHPWLRRVLESYPPRCAPSQSAYATVPVNQFSSTPRVTLVTGSLAASFSNSARDTGGNSS